MTSISDLPPELVGNIFTRVPVTSLRAVRCTCKSWNSLSKEWIVGKEAAMQQFLGFLTTGSKLCSVRFDLRGIKNDLVEQSIKQVALFANVEISQVFHVDGLVLLVTKDNSSLIVWNPYLEQQRWIGPRRKFYRYDKYAIGYDNKSHTHKILRVFDVYDESVRKSFVEYEIYDLSSNTWNWKVLDAHHEWKTYNGVTSKGNTYFFARDICRGPDYWYYEFILLCFDFTRERFGPHVNLPFHCNDEKEPCRYYDIVTLSCVSGERLGILHQQGASKFLNIWIKNKIVEPNALSWNFFFRVDINNMMHQFNYMFSQKAGSFFIDEEKEVAVVFDSSKTSHDEDEPTAYIIGKNRYFKSISLGEINPNFSPVPLVSSFYLPSLLQINQKSKCKRKRTCF